LKHGRIAFAAGHRSRPSLEALIAEAPARAAPPQPDPALPAFIFFTSGSTGPAKGVTHSHETMGWAIACLVRGCEMTANDVVLPGCSLSHIGGFIFSFMTLASAARVIVARTFDGHELLPLLRQQRPTLLVMLPAPLFGLVRDHGAVREDFASVRLCLSGGDKVPGQLEREFTALAGFPIDETFGMTEIGIATISPPSGLNKIGSVGRLIAGYQGSVRDEMGREVATGAEGRLWIRSPCNTIGYWDNAEATAATIKDGWLDTGDVMKFDADGYLWFCGRRKQIIVHDGSNICPQEVEEALVQHAAVEIAGVVGVHDLVHGENVRAFVTFKDGAPPPAPHELIAFARARVGYKAPEDVVVLAEMPINPTGKVDRVALKKMAEERLGHAA
jgi:acyl-coenzyme A synthetase/AMP-(fatty) acid ligase